jgi:ATP-dependent Clp protease, protease subunit
MRFHQPILPAQPALLTQPIRMREAPAAGGLFEGQVFERLLQERIIFLGREVDDAIANTICAQILLLAADDPHRDIVLYINSPGGSVSAGMAVYDTMRFVGNDVATVALGMSASMGQFLLCAGTAGKRYALPHARIMMHQVSGGIGGTSADIAIQAQSMLHVRRTTMELTARHTGQTPEQIAADWDRDRWFTAEQAREYGMVDHVVTTADELSTV